ncbi:site-specific integrase [Geodermatophilus marinus]|nr:site-specific integrase [Geodermatophilus sp. LHW52908]
MGTFGAIHLRVLGRNRVQAGASFRDLDGHHRYVVRNGPTRAQAERRLREALRDRGRTDTPPVPVDSRLGALAARWLAEVEACELAAGTKRLYRFAVDAYVLPGLGELRLREITVPAIDRLLTSIHAEHGPGAAKSTRSVLSGILGLAVRHDLLTTNPVRRTPAHRTARTPRGPRALTVTEAGLLHDRLATDPAAARQDLPDLVAFLLGTGLRIGEACALHSSAVDLDAARLTVTGTVIREPGRGLLIQDTPKTTAGRRTIALPARTADLLRRRTAPTTAEDHPVAFPSPQGRLRDPSNTSGDLRKALDRAGFDWVTSHTFRKTVATRLDEAGLSARQIADHLGHNRPSLTQDVHLGRGTATPGAPRSSAGLCSTPRARSAAPRHCRARAGHGNHSPGRLIASGP